MDAIKKLLQSEWAIRVAGVLLGAVIMWIGTKTGVKPEAPPEWLLPYIQQQQETTQAIKKLEANNLLILQANGIKPQ
jgi:hypothetical protein